MFKILSNGFPVIFLVCLYFIENPTFSIAAAVPAATTAATATSTYKIIPVVKHNQDIKHDGNYYFEYETGNGISHKEIGTDKSDVRGDYKYTAPDGSVIEVMYIADENGFQPVGAHIPAVPEYIKRALEYIRKHPYDPSKDPYSSSYKKKH